MNPLDRQGRAAVAVPGTGARHGDCRVSVGALGSGEEGVPGGGSLVIVMASDDARRRADELIAALSAEQQRAVVDALRADGARDWLDELLRTPDPVVGAIPNRVRGFRVRLDLIGARPPVWRRFELPGDLTLDRLHTVLQAAMGRLDCHLHRFRTGSDPRPRTS
ncbi:plasmid pRiA4b ORF-3 family protein [Rhodococcus rhodochrous]|uniref:plasmid pRiA4b ORF-3 family protein n=1 Tax=Rhodococcus rhodochrous TaxID=1829 RepID=UPI0021F09FD9|nr:plasmid pRiA4b ORF-3 family protein [Rhodococcus rhodochrous]